MLFDFAPPFEGAHRHMVCASALIKINSLNGMGNCAL